MQNTQQSLHNHDGLSPSCGMSPFSVLIAETASSWLHISGSRTRLPGSPSLLPTHPHNSSPSGPSVPGHCLVNGLDALGKARAGAGRMGGNSFLCFGALESIPHPSAASPLPAPPLPERAPRVDIGITAPSPSLQSNFHLLPSH